VLIDIFARIENFFKRLESYTEVPPTAAMTDVILKIIIEVLSILAITTKELKQGRSSELIDTEELLLTYFSLETFVKKLLGRNGIEDALKRLDTLTMEETRMAIAETLKVTNRVDDKVTALIDGEKNACLWLFFACLNTDMARCERSKRSHTAICGHRRCREAFVP
jgi:hypothetical protein